MSIDVWLGYVAACAIVVLIPGPNIVFTVTHALRGGARSGIATIPGVLIGALIAMTVSLAGAGALLSASAFWFSLLKFAGAIYLLWLAFSLWTSPPISIDLVGVSDTKPLAQLFWQGVLVSLLNPKGPPFYAAFVPQFVSPHAPIAPQFALLIGTFLTVACINCLIWLSAARAMRRHFQKPATLRLVCRAGAGCLVVASLLTLRTSRSV